MEVHSMQPGRTTVTWWPGLFQNSGQNKSNIIKIIYAMQGYYSTKSMPASIFQPIFLLTYLNICQLEFLYTVSWGINLLNKMLCIPTEASNTKIKGNLCSYFTIKMILKNCSMQGLNCTIILPASPLSRDRVTMWMSYEDKKWQDCTSWKHN